MSLAKSVPDKLKPGEWEQSGLREPLPVPYVPIKDEVQEEVSKMHNIQIKTLLENDTTLNFPVWPKNRTREAFLMHVMAVLDAIKKRGHFKDYKEAQMAYVENKQVVELAKAGLALLNETGRGLRKGCKAKKAKAKAKEAKAKTQETKAKSKEAPRCPKTP
jgi:hypothetical protein